MYRLINAVVSVAGSTKYCYNWLTVLLRFLVNAPVAEKPHFEKLKMQVHLYYNYYR